jgi:NADPH:quinone reductase-like Zn-dependent oxidoreductase
MKTMKAMRFNDSAVSPALMVCEMEVPQPGRNQVLVRVHAAGATPTELGWYPTSHTSSGESRLGAIPGHEFSGLIEAVGTDVDPSQIGREIFGMNDWFAEGVTADYCVASLTSVVPKPPQLSHAEAASVPIGA